jgi:hypothetical protein
MSKPEAPQALQDDAHNHTLLKVWGKQHERAQRRIDMGRDSISKARTPQPEDIPGLLDSNSIKDFKGIRDARLRRHEGVPSSFTDSESVQPLVEVLVADATELGGHQAEISRHKAIGRRLLEENAADLHDIAVAEAASAGVHIQVQAPASHEQHVDVTVE